MPRPLRSAAWNFWQGRRFATRRLRRHGTWSSRSLDGIKLRAGSKRFWRDIRPVPDPASLQSSGIERRTSSWFIFADPVRPPCEGGLALWRHLIPQHRQNDADRRHVRDDGLPPDAVVAAPRARPAFDG